MTKTLFNLLVWLHCLVSPSHSIVSQILPAVSIFEESPLSTIVADLRPILHTFNVHPNQAALLHSQPSQPFEYINGRIRLKSRLDREDYVRKRLCLGGNVLECNFTLTLTVNLNQAPYNYILSQPVSCHDINDIVPKFSQSDAKISMAENVPVGHRIPLEIATDSDSPPYGIETYRLETIDGHDQSQFSIAYDNQSRELEFVVREKLDREKIEKYQFKLLAIDRGRPPNIATQMLTIEISDVNDSPPRFESSVYNVTVAENTLPEYLLKIRAFDPDKGPHAELTYTLKNDHQGLFRLDRNTGVLTLAQALDYERHKSYQLHVEVTDSQVNPFRDSCTVNIFVLDQNDHAPSIQMRFNPLFEHNQDGTTAYVKESFDIHLPLAFVNVHDEDSGDHGRAQLSVEPSRWFYLEVIRPNEYAVKSSRAFDRESLASYQIELRARDFGQPSLRRSMTFELNITDINDQRPMFKTNYTFDVSENNRVPMIIGQVHAFDSDQGVNGQITYSLLAPAGPFLISPTDGMLSTNTSLDYEKKRHYHFQVRATDHGQPPLDSLTYVDVNIINLNEFAPEFEKENYLFYLDENATATTRKVVGQVKAYDRDYGDQISYSLRDHDDLFRIDRSGRIWTETIFDREQRDEYTLTVLATDETTLTGSATVMIKIKDVNDNAPIFIWPDINELRHVLTDDHTLHLDPAHPTAQFITEIIIQDNDIGNNSLYRLTVSNDALFYIGPNSSLWLRNASIAPGMYDIELKATNDELETRKQLHVLIYQRSPLGLNLLKNMGQKLSSLPVLIIIVLTCFACASIVFLTVYYLCVRRTVQKRLYGSRLIVNDEDKSKQNSPQSKLSSSTPHHDYGVLAAASTTQRKNSSQVPSGTSPATTDGEFSSSPLTCPFNGLSSSTSDLDPSHHQQQQQQFSSTVSALTTLTRKSTRRQPTKNVSFQPPLINPVDSIFNNLFQHSFHENTSSTFGTLPKHNKRDMSSSVVQAYPHPLVLTELPRDHGTDGRGSLPRPPPLLNGIILLDQMLTKSSIYKEEQSHTVSLSPSTSTGGWYNVTSNYQTRASIV